MIASTPVRVSWIRFRGKERGPAHATFDGDRTICGRVHSDNHRLPPAAAFPGARECKLCRRGLEAGRGAWLVQSRSREDLYHLVQNDPREGWSCSCEAGQYGTECWHVRHVQEEVLE